MNETHATKYLLGLPHTAPAGTAERERRILSALGNPHASKNAFLIKLLGEAGKSCVSSLLSSLFLQGRLSVGSVTLTPHNEPRLAIRIDQTPPSHEAFSRAVTRVWNATRTVGIDDPSYEEILLATALLLFAENGCRVMIAELSAHNRSSAASALSTGRLCLFTSCSQEKAAELIPLIDTAGDLVSSPQEPSVYRLLTERAAQTHCRLSFPTKHNVSEATIQNGRLCFSYRSMSLALPTLAHYQKNNALALIEAYHALVRQGFRLTEQHLVSALTEPSTSPCFRFFSLSPAWLIDAADTPLRLEALADSIARLPSLFGDRFVLWTEKHLADDCFAAFGERIAQTEPFELGTVRRKIKTVRPPKDAPLVITGSAAFSDEAYRALNDLFLYS